jgi:hypothetical protein
VINLYRRPDFQAAPALIRSVLSEKCAVKGIPVPTHRSIQDSPYRKEFSPIIASSNQIAFFSWYRLRLPMLVLL